MRALAAAVVGMYVPLAVAISADGSPIALAERVSGVFGVGCARV